MATLVEETTRAAGWLAGQKWQLSDRMGYEDFRPKSEIRQLRRMLRNVPAEMLEGIVAELVSHATVTAPLTEGKVWGGTWNHCKVWWTNEAAGQDNHVLTLYQLLNTGTGASGA
jgi:hypothetical protein